jgi:hypothetical protein
MAKQPGGYNLDSQFSLLVKLTEGVTILNLKECPDFFENNELLDNLA